MQEFPLPLIEITLFLGFVAWLLFWQGGSSRRRRDDDE
jgi:hypothetical protein